jgi:hypothetical protein
MQYMRIVRVLMYKTFLQISLTAEILKTSTQYFEFEQNRVCTDGRLGGVYSDGQLISNSQIS